jgi:hypothetical protein
MNERIRELAEQAGIYKLNLSDETEYWIMEKFAELIVRECQTVVEWAISVDSTIDRVPVLIKEHFGVEE